MIPWEVKQAKPLPGYRLEVTFADGLHGIVDLSDVPHQGVFEAWADPEYFALAEVDSVTGTVCWPNGADIAPDAMHQELKHRRTSAA